MVETWQTAPGERPMEIKPQETKVETWQQVEPWSLRTAAEPVGLRTAVELVGRGEGGRMTSDQNRAGWTRHAGGAIRTMVSGGAEGGRSHGGPDRSRWNVRFRGRKRSQRILLTRWSW